MWRGESKKKQVSDPGDRLLLYKGRACADEGDVVGGEYEDDKENNDDNKNDGDNVPSQRWSLCKQGRATLTSATPASGASSLEATLSTESPPTTRLQAVVMRTQAFYRWRPGNISWAWEVGWLRT